MEWIKKILSKHTGEDKVLDVDKATEEINKTLPTKFVPKDVYNTVATEKKVAEEKVSEYEASQMTDAEKNQAAINSALAEKEKYQKANAKLRAETILVKNGLSAEDYAGFIDGIVGTDVAATEKLATALADTLTAKIKASEDAMKEELLKGTPRPDGGDGGAPVAKSSAEKIAESLAKEISSSNENSAKGISAYTGGE